LGKYGLMSVENTENGPKERDIRSHMVYRLSLFTTIADRNGKVFFHERFGVSLREYRTLGVIGYTAPVSLMELVSECYLDKGQVSRVVAKLIDEGFVCRTNEGEPDGRGGKINLTEKGRTLLDEALRYGEDLNAKAFSVLSEGEKHVFSEYLDRILVHARMLRD
jgi:MarR family transcriptional regulator, organic hydroperoxide resistance regulator